MTLKQPLVSALLISALTAHAVAAQLPTWRGFLDVGSEQERFMRIAQDVGAVPRYPWSMRPFSPAEVQHLAARDTQLLRRWDEQRDRRSGTWRSIVWQTIPAAVGVAYNSAFPFGINDGAVWAGRGATVAVQGGVGFRAGPISAQIEPMVFDAANQPFLLAPTGRTDVSVYANGLYPTNIDLPQRFGAGQYARFDAGQSTIRVDASGFAAAFSTANQFWGPAVENPVILGNNAAGFPHFWVGTSHPVQTRIGQFHARIVWGSLDQTAYSPRVGLGERRSMAGGVGIFVPRGAPGLELGLTRFTHSAWPDHWFSRALFLKPFEGVLVGRLNQAVDSAGQPVDRSGVEGDNQLASAFFRLVLPNSKMEVYGEYGREDRWINFRDFSIEPDHSAAFLLGLQRVWQAGERFTVFRAEVFDSRLSLLTQARGMTPWYVHGGLNQGHTELGQVLGSAGGLGGGASVVAVDRYSPAGRWTVSWGRIMRGEYRRDIPPGINENLTLPNPRYADVIQTLGVNAMRFARFGAVTAGLTGVWDLNRDFRDDAFNLNLTLGFRSRR